MESIKKDARFAHITRDPRFQTMRKKDRKVKIDKRFKGMFTDKRFKLKYTVDKRGRPIHATTNENLRKFYELSASDDSEADGDDRELGSKYKSTDREGKKTKKSKDTKLGGKDRFGEIPKLCVDSDDDDDQDSDRFVTKQVTTSKRQKQKDKAILRARSPSTSEESVAESSSAAESSEGEQEPEIDIRHGPDIARGEGLVSSSSEDDDSELSGQESEEETHPWGEIDKDAAVTEDVSRRLAVCNMDWDRIKASDLMMLFDSFKPAGGVIKSVTIYPSEFGQERMKEEALKGPTELVQPEAKQTLENDKEYQVEKLRKYQLNRLKYYYAVVECDSQQTAVHIYEQCDGAEYEGSSAVLDLRFIPDDMTFEGQEIKSQVCEAPSAETYKPTLFMNSALQQSKVSLTWDETDRDRVSMTSRAFSQDDLETLDVQNYLASDSDEDTDVYGDLVETADRPVPSGSDDEDTQIQKYRDLLQGIQESDSDQERDVDMQISWEPGLKESTSSKKSDQQSDTPWQQYLKKRSDKKKGKKEKKKNSKESKVPVSDPDDHEEFGISDDDVPDDVNLDDPYFKEELDKMRENKKSTKKKKSRRRKSQTAEEQEAEEKAKAELSLLMMEENENRKHFNLKHILADDKELTGKKKRRMRKKMKLQADKQKDVQDDFSIDVTDARFKDLYSNPLYNIDPTAPEFKKTKAVDSLIKEKLRRRKAPCESERESKKPRLPKESLPESVTHKSDPGLASLVKSVKAKTQSVQRKKSVTKRAV